MKKEDEANILKIFQKAVSNGYVFPKGIPQDQPDNLRLHIVRSLVLSPDFLKAFFGTGEDRKGTWFFPLSPGAGLSPNSLKAWQWHGHKMLEEEKILRHPLKWIDENPIN